MKRTVLLFCAVMLISSLVGCSSTGSQRGVGGTGLRRDPCGRDKCVERSFTGPAREAQPGISYTTRSPRDFLATEYPPLGP